MALDARKRRKLDHGAAVSTQSGSSSFGDRQTKDNGINGSSGNEKRIRPFVAALGDHTSSAFSGQTAPHMDSGASLFTIQLDELLAQIRPDYTNIAARVEKALRKVKAVIEDIPTRGPLSVGRCSA